MATNPQGNPPENQQGRFEANPTRPLYDQPQTPPPAPIQPYQAPSFTPAATPKDPQTAMIIEIVAGLLGFLGIGYFYAGRTTDGLIRLIGWWVVLGLLSLSLFIAIGFCLLPVAWLVGPIVSGYLLKQTMERERGIAPVAMPGATPSSYTPSIPTTPAGSASPYTQPGRPDWNSGQQASVQPAMQICPHCGAKNPAGSRFCGECSTPLTTEALVPPPPTGQPVINQATLPDYSSSVPPASTAMPPTTTQATTTTQPLPPTMSQSQITGQSAQSMTMPESMTPELTPESTTESAVLAGSTDVANTPPPPEMQFSTLAAYEQSKTDEAPPSASPSSPAPATGSAEQATAKQEPETPPSSTV